MEKIRAVIFDMDGVIIDSEPLSEEHEKAYFGKMGVIFPEGYFEQLKGMDARSYWTKVINDFKLPHDLEKLIVDVRKSYITFLESQNDLHPIPGVKELIVKLKENKYKVALASSANPKRVELLLKICKMKQLFDIIANTDQVAHGKPAPDIFLKTATLLDIDPQSCLVIEDAENGIKAAKTAGMKVIGFAGLPHNKQNLTQADKIIHSFTELSSGIIQSL